MRTNSSVPSEPTIFAISTPAFAPSRSRYPAIFLQSAEVTIPESGSKSVAYENRTKFPKSGALERNDPRGENFGARQAQRSAEVCAQSPRLLAISARQSPTEKVGRVRTGGGEGTGIRHSPFLM
jgi:hypothetical protein